jgi:hypothetical protein
MFSKVVKGLASLLLWLAGIATFCVLFFGGIYYVLLGAVTFGSNCSTHFGVPRAYIYASPFVFLILWYISSSVVDKIEKRAWKKRTAVDLFSTLFFAIAVELSWILGIAGLLTGPRAAMADDGYSTEDGGLSGRIEWLLAHAPSLTSSGSAALIGVLIGTPLAVRAFLSVSPIGWRNGEVRFLYKHLAYGSSNPIGSNVTPKPRPKGSAERGRGYTARLTVLNPSKLPHAGGHMWVGLLTGVATFCSISAGWSDGLTLIHVFLALIASIITGSIAALQWRASSSRSRK